MKKISNIFRSKKLILLYTAIVAGLFILEIILSNIFGWGGKDAYSLGFFSSTLATLLIVLGLPFPFILIIWILDKAKTRRTS